jgi:hypothetical protein
MTENMIEYSVDIHDWQFQVVLFDLDIFFYDLHVLGAKLILNDANYEKIKELLAKSNLERKPEKRQ